MHAHAIALLKKQQSTRVFEYAPIVRALTNLSMDERSKARTERNFEITYATAQEKLTS